MIFRSQLVFDCWKGNSDLCAIEIRKYINQFLYYNFLFIFTNFKNFKGIINVNAIQKSEI